MLLIYILSAYDIALKYYRFRHNILEFKRINIKKIFLIDIEICPLAVFYGACLIIYAKLYGSIDGVDSGFLKPPFYSSGASISTLVMAVCIP